MPIRPARLTPGDTIGIVSPSSPPPDPRSIDRGVAALEKLGFKIKLAPNVRKRNGFLAGNDRDRASDLMRMFTDQRVNAILCVRGGYGTARILPLLDYKRIRANAKIFVGYSDITAIHCALLTKADLISFHGPMLNSDFASVDMPEFTLKSFLEMLSAPLDRKARNISSGYTGRTAKILRHGVAHGQLIGGNLSVLCTTLGTPWQPSFRNRILFLEDVGERPYRMDRMLTHLLNSSLLQQVAGIAIGINKDCNDPKAGDTKEYRQTVEDVLTERLLPLKVPVVMGLPFGHIPHNATLPVGARVTLNADQGHLIVTSPAVK